MGMLDFLNVTNIFKEKTVDPKQEQDLFEEVLVLVLSRMCRSDSSVDHTELTTVRNIIKRESGRDISEADIRIAASSELFENMPIEKHLAKIASQLTSEHRVKIVNGLTDVINSDDRVSDSEKEFFDRVTKALKASPSELAGMISGG